MAKTITLHYRDFQGVEQFPSRECETIADARKQMKEQSRDKSFFNSWSETNDAWEYVSHIVIVATARHGDDTVIAETTTTWHDEWEQEQRNDERNARRFANGLGMES